MLHAGPISNESENQNEYEWENKTKNDCRRISCDGPETRSAYGQHGPDLTVRHNDYLPGKANKTYREFKISIQIDTTKTILKIKPRSE
jgi:hypothetical protein